VEITVVPSGGIGRPCPGLFHSENALERV
jgi:hypothetical protein